MSKNIFRLSIGAFVMFMASISYAGQSREFRDSSSSLMLTFGLALLIVFLVLAAQFESFVDPFIILFTVRIISSLPP